MPPGKVNAGMPPIAGSLSGLSDPFQPDLLDDIGTGVRIEPETEVAAVAGLEFIYQVGAESVRVGDNEVLPGMVAPPCAFPIAFLQNPRIGVLIVDYLREAAEQEVIAESLWSMRTE